MEGILELIDQNYKDNTKWRDQLMDNATLTPMCTYYLYKLMWHQSDELSGDTHLISL